MDATTRDLEMLTRAVQLAAEARELGNHPFGALIVTADDIIVTAMNTVVTENDPTGHAETNLVRASAHLSAEQLAGATLYTSTEPCAMCAGAIYWSGIGRMVYALSGRALIDMVPSGGPALDVPSRDILAHGATPVDVVGPVDVPEAIKVHEGMWT